MTDLLSMEIAGITFSLRSSTQLVLRNISPVYQQFISGPKHASADDEVEILLESANLPVTGKMRRMFDAEQAWSLFREGDTYFLELKPPPLQEPLWVVRFNAGFKSTVIYCGEPSLSRVNDRISVLNPLSYPIDQILLMYILSGRQGALLHAAGISVCGKGCIFPGRSGAGKSTISRLLLDREGVTMLSDDRIILRKFDSGFRAFGTPWPGDAGLAENISSRLGGIFFIHHDSENKIRELSPREALNLLMPVTSIPWYDEQPMSDILKTWEDLVYAVPAYELYFRPDSSAAVFLEEFLASGAR